MHNPLRSGRPQPSQIGTSVAASTPKVEAAFVLNAEDARALTDAGFIAALHGEVEIVDCIFEPLCEIRGHRAYPWIGRTLARFYAGRAEEAVSLLETVTCEDQEEEAVLRTWHGLALQLSGHRARSLTMLSKVALYNGAGADLARSFVGIKERRPDGHER
jgi:hypothetical protein